MNKRFLLMLVLLLVWLGACGSSSGLPGGAKKELARIIAEHPWHRSGDWKVVSASKGDITKLSEGAETEELWCVVFEPKLRDPFSGVTISRVTLARVGKEWSGLLWQDHEKAGEKFRSLGCSNY